MDQERVGFTFLPTYQDGTTISACSRGHPGGSVRSQWGHLGTRGPVFLGLTVLAAVSAFGTVSGTGALWLLPRPRWPPSLTLSLGLDPGNHQAPGSCFVGCESDTCNRSC
jgi:hypothetical protein